MSAPTARPPAGDGDRPRVLVVGPGPRSAGGIWTVIATMMDSPLGRRYALRRVTTHRDGGAAAKLGQAVAGIATVAGILARRRADLVWVHTSADASFRRKAVVTALARLRRTPVVMHSHASGMADYYRRASGPERAMVRTTLRSADLVIALGTAWRRALTDMTPCVITCVMNPVEVPPLPAERAHIPSGPIVCTGRLGERKGSLVLVRALALLGERYPDARLVLAGDGDRAPVRAEAERLGVADRVELPGWVGHDEVDGLLDRAGVFALPSRNEGLPVALLEAMARGLPCVVTPVGAIPDLVEHGVDALLVPPDDPEALAAAFSRLLDDPEAARAMGALAHATVSARCATPVVADAIDTCFQAVLDGSTARPRSTARGPAG